VKNVDGKSDILSCKLKVTVDELCEDCPKEFNSFLKYVKNLDFADRPDYPGLKKLFQRLAKKHSIDLFDGIYDWSVRAVTMKDYP
jgi:hypothetical protein